MLRLMGLCPVSFFSLRGGSRERRRGLNLAGCIRTVMKYFCSDSGVHSDANIDMRLTGHTSG